MIFMMDPEEVKVLAKGILAIFQGHFKPYGKDDIEERARQLGISIQAVDSVLDVLNKEALEIGLTFENIDAGGSTLQ